MSDALRGPRARRLRNRYRGPVIGARLGLAIAVLVGARGAGAQAPAGLDRGDVMTFGGVRMGGPMVASLFVGPAFVTSAEPRFHEAHGVIILAEPGVGGGQLGVGYGKLTPFGGFRMQGLLLRTWGDPRLLAPDQTFVGIEGNARFGFGLSVTFYQRVGGGPAGRERRVALSGTFGV